jgi:hypothetical protein
VKRRNESKNKQKAINPKMKERRKGGGKRG